MDLILERLARPRTATWLRAGVPIAGAALFLLLWVAAEAGRTWHLPKAVMFGVWAIGLACAGIAPYVALAAVLLFPAVMLVSYPILAGYSHSSWAMESAYGLSTSWPVWLAAPMIVGWVAATRPGRVPRYVALCSGLAGSTIYAVVLVLSGWDSWTGGGDLLPASGWAWRFLAPVLFELIAALGAAVVIAWLIGIGLAALWRVQIVTGALEHTAAQLDEADLELRLAHDRGRISRDIHDSLAHSLAIIVAQAEGAAAIHELKPEAAPESLANIATVARHALGEVRRLVERITDDADVSEHTSRLEHIPNLIDEVRSVGVDASLRTLGDPAPLALSKQVAVFRIVQESLTNALKHGGRGTAVTVTLDAQGAGLAVLVVSKTGGGAPLVQSAGRGIGIAGMKERARLVGGWLTAVPSDDETFVVTAFIPPDVDVELEGPRVAGAADGASASPADADNGPLAIEGARG